MSAHLHRREEGVAGILFTFDLRRRFHLDEARLDLSGRTLGHALVGSHVGIGGVLDHQRSVLQHLISRVVLGADFVAENVNQKANEAVNGTADGIFRSDRWHRRLQTSVNGRNRRLSPATSINGAADDDYRPFQYESSCCCLNCVVNYLAGQ